MKRIVKKVFAFMLAVSLCVTQLALPVLADTVTTETTVVGNTEITTTVVAGTDGSVSVTTEWTTVEPAADPVLPPASVETGTETESFTLNADQTSGTATGSSDITNTENETEVESDETQTQSETPVMETETDTTASTGSTTQEGQWTEEAPQENIWVERPGQEEAAATSDGPGVTTQLNDVTPNLSNGTLEFTTPGVVDSEAEAETTYTADSETVTITMEDVLNGLYDLTAAENDPNTTVAPITEEINGVQTVVGYTITTTKQTGFTSTPGTVEQSSTVPSGSSTITTEENVTDPAYEALVDQGAQYLGNGTTEQVTRETDSNNQPYYRKTTTTVTREYADPDNPNDPQFHYTETLDPSEDQPQTIRQDLGTTYTPPAMPTPVDGPDAQGRNVTHTVTTMTDASGNLYYNVSYVLTDAEGNVVGGGSEDIYGSTATTSQVTVIDPVTKEITLYYIETITESYQDITFRKTTESSYTPTGETRTDHEVTTYETTEDAIQLVRGQNLIQGADGLYYVELEGRMYAILDNSENLESDIGDGDGSELTLKEWTYNYNRTGLSTQQASLLWGYGWMMDEDGNHIQKADGSDLRFSMRCRMYELTNADGESRWVYCIEAGTADVRGSNYQEYRLYDDAPEMAGDPQDDYDCTNEALKEGVYTMNSDTRTWATGIRELTSIMTNGYQKTTDGPGSLAAVQDFLRRNQENLGLSRLLTDEEINNLTEQQVMAATQAAVWKYGSPANMFFVEDAVRALYEDPPQEYIEVANVVYQALVNQAQLDAAANVDENGNYIGASQELTGESITGAAITLNNKVIDNATNEVATDANGNEMYNADVAFTLNISATSITGNMVVSVVDENGRTAGRYQLARNSNDSALVSLFDGLTGTVRPMADGSYVLEGVELYEGVKFNVKLEGIQHLTEGVAVYVCADSQDFIGSMVKEREVDIQFAMEFHVNEPEFTHERTVSTSTSSQDVIYDAYDVTGRSRVDTITEDPTVTVTTNSVGVRTITARVVTMKTVSTEVRRSRNWEEYVSYLTTLVSDEAEGGGVGTVNADDTNIPDEAVPLAAAPKTGDASQIFAAVSLISLAGSLLLKKKEF